MKHMKLTKLAAVLISSSLALAMPATVSAEGIPTVDWVLVQKATQQISNQIQQIAQLKAQIDALRSQNNWRDVARETLKASLPDEWRSVYQSFEQAARSSDLLTSKGYNANADRDRLVKHLDLLLRGAKDSQRGLKAIETLYNKLNETQDIKSAQDLQNRIALEQAKIQQRQTELDTMERMMNLQERIQIQKQNAYLDCKRENIIRRTNKPCN